MAIIYVKTRKPEGGTPYESTSVWNPELKQPRAKRKYLGVVDEETGEIIPSSKKRGRRPNPDRENKNETNEKQASGGREETSRSLKTCRRSLTQGMREIKELKAANRKLKSKLNRITSIVESDD